MAIYSTEITSDTDPSDSPLHNRLLKAYIIAKDLVAGEVFEAGCGEGRGVSLIIPNSASYTALDKIEEALVPLREKFPLAKFLRSDFPPFAGFPDNSFDCIISFQVIEHIKDDSQFLKEINRILKPGGKAYLTTPNRVFSLTRNPWHIREYTASELVNLANRIFFRTKIQGIDGNDKVKEYYEANRRSVQKITQWDFFDLQYRMPAWLLRVPYEILNRLNRLQLKRRQSKVGLHYYP